MQTTVHIRWYVVICLLGIIMCTTFWGRTSFLLHSFFFFNSPRWRQLLHQWLPYERDSQWMEMVDNQQHHKLYELDDIQKWYRHESRINLPATGWGLSGLELVFYPILAPCSMYAGWASPCSVRVPRLKAWRTTSKGSYLIILCTRYMNWLEIK